MSAADKILSAAEDLGDRAKDDTGNATGSDQHKTEGRADQIKHARAH